MPQENTATQSQSPPSIELLSSLFNEALALQQQKNWDGALAAYSRLLDFGPKVLETPQLSAIYHNMSAVAAQQSDHLKAYVWNKLALHHNSFNKEALAASRIYEQAFSPPGLLQKLSGYEVLQRSAAKVPADAWLVSALIFSAFFLQRLSRAAIRHKEFDQRKSFWSVPRWSLYALAASALLGFFATFLAFTEQGKIRAYVLTSSAPVQTAPGENKSVIFEAPGGIELEVLGEQDGFIQVRRAGVFSGWVLRSQLALTTSVPSELPRGD